MSSFTLAAKRAAEKIHEEFGGLVCGGVHAEQDTPITADHWDHFLDQVFLYTKEATIVTPRHGSSLSQEHSTVRNVNHGAPQYVGPEMLQIQNHISTFISPTSTTFQDVRDAENDEDLSASKGYSQAQETCHFLIDSPAANSDRDRNIDEAGSFETDVHELPSQTPANMLTSTPSSAVSTPLFSLSPMHESPERNLPGTCMSETLSTNARLPETSTIRLQESINQHNRKRYLERPPPGSRQARRRRSLDPANGTVNCTSSVGSLHPGPGLVRPRRHSQIPEQNCDLDSRKLDFINGLGGKECLLRLSDILREAKNCHEQSAAGEKVTTVEEIFRVMEAREQRVLFHVLQQWVDAMNLCERLRRQASNQSSERFRLITADAFKRPARRRIGNPEKLDSAKITKGIMQRIFPNLQVSSSEYRQKMETVKDFCKCGSRLLLMTESFGKNTICLALVASVREQEITNWRRHIIFSISGQDFLATLKELEIAYGNHLRETSRKMGEIFDFVQDPWTGDKPAPLENLQDKPVS